MTVFANEKTVFFAINHADAVIEAGGCTQAWWDAEVAANGEAAAMAKLMGSNGLPLINDSALDYTHLTQRIDAAVAGDFTNVEVGMVAYVSGSYITTDRYKITEAYDDYIILSGIVSTDDYYDTVLVIGGAFEDLQDALDETDAMNHSTTIHVKSVSTLVASIDINMGGGNNAKNTFKKINGFNTSPSDMNYRGTYYQSPFEILQNGSIDNTKAVILDGNGGGFNILEIAQDNIIIENIHCYNSTVAAIVTTSVPQNIVFRNCKVSACQQAALTTAEGILFDSCYIHDDLTSHYFVTNGGLHTYLNCIFNMAAGKNVMNIIAHPVTFMGCIVAGVGQFGLHILNAGSSAVVMNNTFYGLTTYAIYLNTGDNAIIANNIFSLAPGAVAFRIGATGSISYNDYNCFIETDGTPLTVGSHASGYTAPVLGPHSIVVDPQFMNTANDFRLKSTSPCINTGKPIVDGNMSMGAWPRISRIRR